MTGRKNRVVSNEDGTISYESRSKQDVPLELLNIAEKKRFMDGEKVRPGLPLAGHFSTFRLDYDAQSVLYSQFRFINKSRPSQFIKAFWNVERKKRLVWNAACQHTPRKDGYATHVGK